MGDRASGTDILGSLHRSPWARAPFLEFINLLSKSKKYYMNWNIWGVPSHGDFKEILVCYYRI